MENSKIKFSLFTDNGAMNSKPVFEAFSQGCQQLGHEVVYNNMDADVAVIWSVLWHGRMASNKRVWDTYRSKNKPVIVLEVGALHRNIMWKVGINGINREANFGEKENTSDRADSLGLKLKPWNSDPNGDIVICTQHDKSHQWRAMPPITNWVLSTIEDIRKYTDRRIILRPHPRCKLNGIQHEFNNVYLKQPTAIQGTYDDFDLYFDGVYAVVNVSSNPATQAILNGIPAFVDAPSLAYDVSNDIHFMHDIETPLRPDRQQWLNDLAYTEWSVPEIAQGVALKRLTSFL